MKNQGEKGQNYRSEQNRRVFTVVCLAAIMMGVLLCSASCKWQRDEGTMQTTEATARKDPSLQVAFSPEGYFFTTDLQVYLETIENASIYYTLDGRVPEQSDTLYTGEPIRIWRSRTGETVAVTIKARAFYEDGRISDVATHTYFCAKDIDQRFSTVVFSVSADPAVLTQGPDGIFFGENYQLRGDESERQVYLEMWDTEKNLVLHQSCGLRIYGGVSRANPIKSVKLFARKRYDPAHGKFNMDIFSTAKEDGTGDVIGEYDKLVLRNAGNDHAYAFIRDELCHMLAKDAGFTDYESVLPAVCFLNGEYYGLFWLHESYCDDYFKEKYPRKDAEGDFVILEGSDMEKDLQGEEEKDQYARQWNAMYQEFAQGDLTDEALFAKLRQRMDVENYLRYFAFQIYINNKDWPQNNFKCYRYCGEDTVEGTVYDGKWRFLLHDMDYSFWLYQESVVAASYNNLEEIMTPGTLRYSPLFTALMAREDCRNYFRDRIWEYAQGALSPQNVQQKMNVLHRQFHEEMKIFSALQGRTTADVESQLQKILVFANQREGYMKSFVEQLLEK